jgi:hypothetical protein
VVVLEDAILGSKAAQNSVEITPGEAIEAIGNENDGARGWHGGGGANKFL